MSILVKDLMSCIDHFKRISKYHDNVYDKDMEYLEGHKKIKPFISTPSARLDISDLAKIIEEYFKGMTHGKQNAINRMKEFIHHLKEECDMDISPSIQFPPEHVNIDDRESRIRFMSSLLSDHKLKVAAGLQEPDPNLTLNQKAIQEFAKILWISDRTVRSDLAYIENLDIYSRRMRGQTLNMTSRIVRLSLNLNLTEVKLLLSQMWEVRNTFPSDRPNAENIISNIWKELNKSEQSRLLKLNVISDELLLEYLGNLSTSDKLNKSKGLKHFRTEDNQLLASCVELDGGWYQPPQIGLDHWLINCIKRGLSDYIFEIEYRNDDNDIQLIECTRFEILGNNRYHFFAVNGEGTKVNLNRITSIRFKKREL